MFADPDARVELVGCSPADLTDPCVADFLARFSRRAYRRPATSDELARITGVAEAVSAEADDVWTSLSYSVSAMLQSPNFLYRVELGEPDPGSSWRRYTGFEIATRLSYLLTASTPDDELLAAAEAGELDSPSGIRAQTDRLLQHDNGRPGCHALF